MPNITDHVDFDRSGVQTVTDTAAVVATGVSGKACQFQAPLANTGDIFIGGSGVSSANGYILSPGQSTGILPGKPSDYHVVGPGTSEEVRYLNWR